MHDSLSVLVDLMQDTRRPAPVELLGEAPNGHQPVEDLYELPEPAPGLPIEEVLRRRLSIRYYDPSPISQACLAAVLGAADQADSDLWPGEHRASPLELLVAAWRVQGLETGLYRYRAPHGLARAGSLPPADEARELVLQLEYSAAPALVLVVGDLRSMLRRHGSHGHRLLLVRGGAAAHSGWLAAIGAGLDGSVFAGFLPVALRELAGLDGYTRMQVFALAIGPPIGSPAR